MTADKKKEQSIEELEAEALPLTKHDHKLTHEIDALIKERNEVRRKLRGVVNKITTKKMHESAAKK